MFVCAFCEAPHSVLAQMAPGMPPDYWWVTGAILLILALTATVDAFTAIIPEIMIFLGLLAVTLVQGCVASWEIAAQHLREAIAFGFVIWGINFLWYAKFHYDALGMGDAKWSMLAVACFGVTPVIYAWGVGAILASVCLGVIRLFRYQMTQITFGPFLLIGLGLGLYALRFW